MASDDMMPSPGEPIRQQELAAMRDERDAARLRELYENAVGNRERFGRTINHLLECEALASFEAEAEIFERERDEARRQRDELLGAIERYEAAMTQPLSAGPARTRIWRKALYDTAKRIRSTEAARGKGVVRTAVWGPWPERCVCMGGSAMCVPPFGSSGGCSLSADEPIQKRTTDV